MNFHAHLIILGAVSAALAAYLPFQIPNKNLSLVLTLLSTMLSLGVTFWITRTSLVKEYEARLTRLKERYEKKIHGMKKEHDTTTLKKTIRDGTQTLIKNAVDYFKIENIKNEMPPSAAIQNLQLDKYGQIIELLADFSLILPDYHENLQIVQQELTHQIEIYQIDEEPFARFLRRIMEKYHITVNKKIREKVNVLEGMKSCPQCAEKVLLKAKICKHCGFKFDAEKIETKKSDNPVEEAVQALTGVIQMNPNYSQAYFDRGMLYERLGNSAQAANDLSKAAQLGHVKAQEFLRQTQTDPGNT